MNWKRTILALIASCAYFQLTEPIVWWKRFLAFFLVYMFATIIQWDDK